MAKLYATVTGDTSSTAASRRGHRNIGGHVRGWNAGIEIEGRLDADGNERLEVYLTSGSSGAGAREHLGVAYIGAGGPTFVYSQNESPMT